MFNVERIIEIPVPIIPEIIFFVLMGALSAMLANRGLCCYHDGLRPTIPALVSGQMKRSEISAISFALAIGFFVGLGIPLSVGLVIPSAYLLFIMTDWIGVSFPGEFGEGWKKDPKSLFGFIGSGIAGGLFGLAMAVGLNWIVDLGSLLPVDMFTGLQSVSSPIMAAFTTFPALTIGYRYGLKKGILGLSVSVLAWYIALELGASDGQPWALGAGMVLLIVFAVLAESKNRKEKKGQEDAVLLDSSETTALFTENVKRIKKAIVPITLLSGLIGAASTYAVISVDPVQASLAVEGNFVAAALVAVTWGIAFAPMKYTTALATGCMVTYTFFETALAMLMPNWIVSFFAVAALRVVEIYALVWLAKLFDRFSEIRAMADTLRTCIFHVMEVGLLIGGALAASTIAGGVGFVIVVGAWWLNKYADSPIMPMAIGPIAAIAVGIIANIFAFLGIGA